MKNVHHVKHIFLCQKTKNLVTVVLKKFLVVYTVLIKIIKTLDVIVVKMVIIMIRKLKLVKHVLKTV